MSRASNLDPADRRPIPQRLELTAAPRTTPPESRRSKIARRGATLVDRMWGWDRLPRVLSIPTLIALRGTLRRENLFDADHAAVGSEPLTPWRSSWRSVDGKGTDANHPEMGAAGTKFGRNVPLEDTARHEVRGRTWPGTLGQPNPQTVSDKLLARPTGTFQAATSLNLLAAAWVQFEVHDWISHGANDKADPWLVADPDDDQATPSEVRRTRHVTGDGPTTYRNTQSHWWDASQVYGSTPELAEQLRHPDGRHLLRAPGPGFPFDPPNDDVPGELAPAKDSWWAGLALLHGLFIREHNAIVDHLAREHPELDDEALFQTTRLVNAALIAKIHTLEWTPALLANPRTEWALRINWWGLQGERLHRWFGRLARNEVLSGIPGSDVKHYGVPYALTEEFLAVYRMHPLIPDDVPIRSSNGGHPITTLRFEQLSGHNTRDVLDHGSISAEDLIYSLATGNPGQLVLNNYPNQLRQLELADGRTVDLAMIDILRDRERGILPYNEFRRRLRLRPATRFEDFSTDPEVVQKLREVYPNPETVDLMVGLYAEKKPDGFAFSDTAFRVFILMASRRLNSDRFLTSDYREHIYTKEGLQWIERTTLPSILARHYPQLALGLRGVRNAFKPWDQQ